MTVGTQIGNGSIILAIRPHKYGGFVVLCDTNNRSGTKYATWRCTNCNDTTWGHYFDDLHQATVDFEGR